jgi:hypothetical protein
MGRYGRIVILFAVVVVLLLVVYVFKRASAPESSIIAKERNRLAASIDKDRQQKDLVYARDMEAKLEFLDSRRAEAYVKEESPDEAIKLLQALIGNEQGRSKTGHRRSSSYAREAGYFETLQNAYRLKQDQAGAERAGEQRTQLLAKAESARRSERLSEGTSVGIGGE